MIRLAALLLLAACASPIERVVPTGERVAPPWGWQDWCARNPDDPACPKAAP